MTQTSIGIKPVRGHILIDVYDTGDAIIELGGRPFYLLGDNNVKSFHNATSGQHPGIRPRWATVLATSPEAEEIGVRCGDDILCDTMKWSRKVPYYDGDRRMCFFSRLPIDDILLIRKP